jgi:hypothetical protein
MNDCTILVAMASSTGDDVWAFQPKVIVPRYRFGRRDKEEVLMVRIEGSQRSREML